MYTGWGFTSEPESSGAKVSPTIHILLNPLITDDECTRPATLDACYQLAQSVLKIVFMVAKKGEVSRFQDGLPCTWQLPWLAIEKPWSALAWPFLSFLTQMGVERVLYLCKSATAHSFQLREAFTGQRALTIVSSLIGGRGKVYEPWQTWWKNT